MNTDHWFQLSYCSEVSVLITIEKEETYRLTARHPYPSGDVTIRTWFHFSDVDPPEGKISAEGENLLDCMVRLGERLYPGVEEIMDCDNPKEQFFTDLFIAFCYGKWLSRNYTETGKWGNNVGERLLNHV